MRLDFDALEFGVADFGSGWIPALVEFRPNLESLLGGGVGDQIDNDFVADQGSASPVLRDVTEHGVFDLVPLAGSGREMTHANRDLQLVSECLQCHLPQAATTAVAPATVRHDQQFGGLRMTWASNLFPPATNRGRGELGRVVIDADT